MSQIKVSKYCFRSDFSCKFQNNNDVKKVILIE